MQTNGILRIYGSIGKDIELADARAVLRRSGTAPVEVRIRSEGGSGSESLYIAQAIADHPGPTTGRVHLHCNSGAILCFAACKHRITAADATFGFHRPIPTWPSTTESDLAEFTQRYVAFLVERIGIAWLMAETLMNGGFTLTAKEALAYRLATEVI
jgi:ATP-dependent protease ClpP protease subunit